jgi:hypothetical protein
MLFRVFTLASVIKADGSLVACQPNVKLNTRCLRRTFRIQTLHYVTLF